MPLARRRRSQQKLMAVSKNWTELNNKQVRNNFTNSSVSAKQQAASCSKATERLKWSR